jgi:hypothetical protein
MGLITSLLTLPLAPVRGTVWAADQILKQAEDAYYDPAAIRSELEDVDRLRVEGRIDEETAAALEDELIERLMIGQERSAGHG